ncbi:MAG: hypothetical protein JWM21_4008 [Acidobacteria bacterium]|nr:hypothetical protein [Acidobacteriota bacterium]
MKVAGKDQQVKYCVTAIIDLLGFSSHLEIGGNDLRTNIGQEAVNRLQILEDAIRLMNDERVLCKDEYPKEFYYTRINDAVILTLDLPRFFTPSVGELIKRGVSANEIDQFFDLDSIGGDEEFEQAYVTKLSEDTGDLVRFVGLIARIHHYVNRKENTAYFPGAKTVVASGYRRTFFAEGKEDFLAANFSFSNAYLAEKDLHGSNLFLDNNIVQLLCANRFARNLLRFASYVSHPAQFDLFREYDDPLFPPGATVKKEPVAVSLFRKRFSFRELNPSILAYLQVIPRLSTYLLGEKKSKAESFSLSVFEAMKEGPSKADLNLDSAPIFRGRILREDIENDIRIFSEIVECGESAILKEQRERSLRELVLKAPHPS